MLRLELIELDDYGYISDFNGAAGANLGGNNLVLNDYIPSQKKSVSGELWMSYLNNPAAKPFKISDVVAGQRVQIPFAADTEVRFYLVSHDPNGKKTVADLSAAKIIDFTPNRETQIPVITPRTAENARIVFDVTNFTPLARFRKILVADDVNFSVNLQTILQSTQNQPGLISPTFEVTRSGDTTNSKTVFVKIAHSSNNKNFGQYSLTKQVSFVAANGSGGSGGETPPPQIAPPGLSALTSSGLVVSGTITNNGGTNPINLFRQQGTGNFLDLGIISPGPFTDTAPASGTYSYKVAQEGAGESPPQTVTVSAGAVVAPPLWNDIFYDEFRRRLNFSWVPQGGSGDFLIEVSTNGFDFSYFTSASAGLTSKSAPIGFDEFDRTLFFRISRDGVDGFNISDGVYVPGYQYQT